MHAGERLRYDSLAAYDADGKGLPIQLVAAAGGLAIEVDERDARYPIVIDPLYSSASWSAEGDQDSARLGSSVAAAGDVNGDGYGDVIVGSHLFDGGSTDEGPATRARRAACTRGCCSSATRTPASSDAPNAVHAFARTTGRTRLRAARTAFRAST